MKYKSIAFLTIISCLAFETAQAYVYFFTPDGARQHWENEGQQISYSINQYGSEDIESFESLEYAINQSFIAWQSVPLSTVSFFYQGETELSQRSADNTNLVIFDSQPIAYNGGLFTVSDQVGPTVIGIAINNFYSESGEIIDSDIIFNDLEYTFTVTQETDLSQKRIKLQDVATHEIGHLLGLDHTFIEQGTMFPFARSGQSTLSADDSAGVASLYPSEDFYYLTDSLGGTVTDTAGNPIWGIYVSAFKAGTDEEKIAAITGSQGRYTIMGLEQNTAYKIKARSVDLVHLGSYIKQSGDPNHYIPKYYDDVYRLADAEPVTTGFGSTGFDFSMEMATTISRYEEDFPTIWITTVPVQTITSSHYLAVRFPASSLPPAFNVFGTTFWNNDLHMTWPSITLTGGTDTSPDLDNILGRVTDYIGQERDYSTVEWETATLTNNRTLWVVFQLPDLQVKGAGEGPAIGCEQVEPYRNDLFYSTDNGQTFNPHTSANYDPLMKLTVRLAETSPQPVVQFEITQLDFGFAKVNSEKILSVPISNTGTADLNLSEFESSKLNYFTITADHTLIPAGATDTLRIRFTPLTTTTKITGTVLLSTDDPTQPSITISVSGQGAHPAAAVGATALDFGEVEVGSSAQKSLAVRSTGQVSLLVTDFQFDSIHFSLAVDSIEIPAGDSAVVNVTFAPKAGGAFSDNLYFSTDDPANPGFTVALSGTGLGDAAKDCDFTGDGKSDATDIIAFLLIARNTPQDTRLDWNGDGKYTIADVLGLLLDLKGGRCSSTAVAFSASQPTIDTEWRAGLTADEIAYLERMISLISPDQQTEQELRLALYGPGSGSAELPKAYSLAQNNPNPFNPSTAISYSVPEGVADRHVSIRIYDIRGRLVRVLVDGFKSAGTYTVFWHGTDQSAGKVASGVYIYRMKAGGSVFTRKMVLLK